MAIWEALVNPLDSRVGKMIVVVVRDHNSINEWQVFYFTWHLRVALWTQPREWGTTVFKHGVKENPKAAWELYIVASMAQPGRPKLWSLPIRQELRLAYGYRGRCGVWDIGFAHNSSAAIKVLGLREIWLNFHTQMRLTRSFSSLL